LVIKAGAATEPSRGFTNDPGMGPGAMPRYAPTNKLRAQTRAGMGELQAEQLAVQRMQRMTTETADVPRHVVVIGDVTRGLGLNQVDEQRIQKAVEGTNVEFSPKTQTQRLFLARGSLATLLRSMTEVNGDARMEIAKRATAWWKKSADTDLNRSRTVHFISYPQSTMAKGGKPKGKVERWITVNGARIPIIGGKPAGALADKIFGGKGKKKKGKKGKKPGEKPAAAGGKKGKGKKTTMAQALGEGYEAGERAKVADVRTLAGVVDRQRQRDEATRKSDNPLVFTRPTQRTLNLEWK
jgi:hypothetical protein